MLTGISTNRKNWIDTKLNKTGYLPMIANWQYGEEGRWSAAVVSVSEMLTRLIFNRRFSRLLYNFFSPTPLKPCGYFTCLIMMQHVSFSPSLYSTAWHVLRKDLRDLRVWLSFPFAGRTLLGMGLQQNIKMNTKCKWLFNTCRSHPTSWRVFVMVSVFF